jgi:hypothetical protein
LKFEVSLPIKDVLGDLVLDLLSGHAFDDVLLDLLVKLDVHAQIRRHDRLEAMVRLQVYREANQALYQLPFVGGVIPLVIKTTAVV